MSDIYMQGDDTVETPVTPAEGDETATEGEETKEEGEETETPEMQ